MAFNTLVQCSVLDCDVQQQGGHIPGYQFPHVVALCLAEADQRNAPDPLVCKVLIIQCMLLWYVMFGKLDQLQHLEVDLLFVVAVDQGSQHPITFCAQVVPKSCPTLSRP